MAKPLTSIPTDDAPHLLVVDDDKRIRELLSRYLGEHGYRVTTAALASEARRKFESLDFDLIILDVMMPGESGIELTTSLRITKQVPILLLTALTEVDDKIAGLSAGADDYLAKPFDPRELVLRIEAILKRTGRPSVGKPVEIRFGHFAFNIERRELRHQNDLVRLTDREQELLTAFAVAPDGTVSRFELAGGDGNIGERTIDVQINRLRRKIEDDPSNPLFLQTVRGIGYRLRIE